MVCDCVWDNNDVTGHKANMDEEGSSKGSSTAVFFKINNSVNWLVIRPCEVVH